MEQKLVTLIGTKPFDPQTVLCPICGNVMAPKNAYDDVGDDALEFDYICPDCQSELTVYAADADKQPEPKAIIGEDGKVYCRTMKNADECTRWQFDCRCDNCPMESIVKGVRHAKG